VLRFTAHKTGSGWYRAGVVELKPQHQSNPTAGMYRFETSSGKQRSSSYITFRTISEGSPGWILPARTSLHIARDVADGLRSDADEIFGGAWQADVDANGSSFIAPPPLHQHQRPAILAGRHSPIAGLRQ
jgi:hypothetical protein